MFWSLMGVEGLLKTLSTTTRITLKPREMEYNVISYLHYPALHLLLVQQQVLRSLLLPLHSVLHH